MITIKKDQNNASPNYLSPLVDPKFKLKESEQFTHSAHHHHQPSRECGSFIDFHFPRSFLPGADCEQLEVHFFAANDEFKLLSLFYSRTDAARLHHDGWDCLFVGKSAGIRSSGITANVALAPAYPIFYLFSPSFCL